MSIKYNTVSSTGGTSNLKACRYCGYVTTHAKDCGGINRPSAYERGVADTAEKIAAWLDRVRPHAKWHGKGTCEHDAYPWESCEDCLIDQLAEAIRAGEWK